MNDFTKEDLKKIQDSLIFLGTIEKNIDFDLCDKIQSMIANYCDHEYSPEDALNIPLHYLKCGEKFE